VYIIGPRHCSIQGGVFPVIVIAHFDGVWLCVCGIFRIGQFNKSLKNIADHLQFVQGNDISEAVHNMAPIKIDIPPSAQDKSSGAHQTSSILCQVIVTDRKSFPTHLR
jgi:hypothetical protein